MSILPAAAEKICDRVTRSALSSCHAAGMVKPPAISLRLRADAANFRACRILRERDEADLLQRRVKWLATKSLISVREMNRVAAPKLRSMVFNQRDGWDVEYALIESILVKISKVGVEE
jgi:hypothetical protein